ncbi:MFS transporter [Pseudogemmobacter humi]|uniref:Inner membrane protein YbjJ n=1 Tax=Pseudogemmobacter humi TaxID=2483812 RepID=A0A3P5XG22_9RHOB|nr:MFS transporter [Pseudogemmobacter humi]VDC33736.1 Inner membrane protein YbjJ [Pseudogemmobacter humi]
MTPGEARAARLALAAMFAANGFLIGAWAPQIPLLLPRHGIGEGALGLLILLLGLGAMAAMLFSGRIIAQRGSLWLLRRSSLALIPALPLVALAPSPLPVALAMGFFGLTMGAMDVAMNANAVAVERWLGRATMSALHGFWSLGAFAGSGAGAWLITQTSPGVQALAAAACAGAAILGALAFARGEPPAPMARTTPGRLLPREAGIWILGVMALLAFVPEGAVLDWAALYLGADLGADPFLAGLGYALFAAAMALMRFLGDRLRNRFGAVRVLRVSALIAALGLGIAAAAPWLPLALAGLALAGLGSANLVPVIFSAAGNFPGQSPGAALSAVTMVGYAGILIAPAAIGFAAEYIGLRVTYAALAALVLVIAALAGRTASADHRVVY